MASTQLLELSRQVLHPPTHPNHIVSLYSSLLAIRRCLNLEAHRGALSIEATCAAWTLLAEIGLSVLAAGLGAQHGPDWARGISTDVERAISEGLKISRVTFFFSPVAPSLTYFLIADDDEAVCGTSHRPPLPSCAVAASGQVLQSDPATTAGTCDQVSSLASSSVAQ